MLIRFVSLLVILTFIGCEKPVPLTVEQAQKLVEGSPKIIVSKPHVTLVGLTDFYLTQPQDDAERALKKICGNPLVYEGGYRRENAVFKGCTTPEHPDFHSFRIGMHPKLDFAVFTVEVQRRNIELLKIRARFYTELEIPFEDLPRRGILRMRSENYNLFASSDDGEDGPVHIILGLNPEKI